MATKYFIVLNIFKYFLRLGEYSLYCVCWACVRILDYMAKVWMVSSIGSKINTAQLGWILWKQKFSIFSETSPVDFLCMFRTRVSLEYVLRPTVSLYAITKKEAIFVETPEGVNINSSDVHPFFIVAQFRYATTVIKMTVRDFVSLAEKVGDPKVPVIWMSNTGRCGGTMLCQVFESVPGTLAIHEPDPITNVHFMNENNTLQASEYGILLKSMVRIMCKPRPGVTRICIKPRPQCTAMMKKISELGLDIKQLFIYRNSFDTVRSWLAIMSYDPFLVFVRVCTDAHWFSKLLPKLRNIFRYYYIQQMNGISDLPMNSTVACVFAYSWANQILIARDAQSCDRSIQTVKYEDIISQSRKTVTQLFERCGIDTEHVERAVATLSRDSQRGSSVSRAKIGDESHRHITEAERTTCDAILTQCNLPLLGEDFRFENMP